MNNTGKYCLSSRVRIARNIKGLPFTKKMSESEARQLIEKIQGALGKTYTYINFSSLPENKKMSYIENHVVSPNLLKSNKPTALFTNEDKSIAVMVGEEDHIRIQAFTDGLDLDTAFKKAEEAERIISEQVEYMFDSQFGYITQCPTNIGTGIRASVMMFLPATLNSKTIASYSSDLAKAGITIRGYFGESSNSVGELYQISNAQTLGVSEEETIDKVKKTALFLAELEEKNENLMYSSSKNTLTDSCMRALGLLSSSYMMSNEEAQLLLSRVRLASNLGILDVSPTKINSAMNTSFPHTLSIHYGKDFTSPQERDLKRAEYMKNIFRQEPKERIDS